MEGLLTAEQKQRRLDEACLTVVQGALSGRSVGAIVKNNDTSEIARLLIYNAFQVFATYEPASGPLCLPVSPSGRIGKACLPTRNSPWSTGLQGLLVFKKSLEARPGVEPG